VAGAEGKKGELKVKSRKRRLSLSSKERGKGNLAVKRTKKEVETQKGCLPGFEKDSGAGEKGRKEPLIAEGEGPAAGKSAKSSSPEGAAPPPFSRGKSG